MSAVDRVGRQARSSGVAFAPRDAVGCDVRFRQLRTYRSVRRWPLSAINLPFPRFRLVR